MAEKILTLHPEGKSGVNIDRAKYEQMKEAINTTLQEHGELTFTDLTREIRKRLYGKFEGSIPWYAVTVKLDLEARGVLVRSGGAGPQKIRLAT